MDARSRLDRSDGGVADAASTDPATTATVFTPWWGPLDLAQDETRRWRVGPRTLWVARRADEVAVASTRSDDPSDRSLELAAASDEPVPDDAERLRFAVRSDAPPLELVPALADRAAVVRPDAPLTIPAGEEVTLFVSSPVWLVLRIAARRDAGARVLVEVPSWRPSDTWFGTNTLRGELAYALATTARFALGDAVGPPHRATTPVRVRNREDQPLRLERLKIPLPNLALYASRDRLWTTGLTLVHEGDEERTALALGSGVPDEAGSGATRVAQAREATTGNLVMRAFARFFRSD